MNWAPSYKWMIMDYVCPHKLRWWSYLCFRFLAHLKKIDVWSARWQKTGVYTFWKGIEVLVIFQQAMEPFWWGLRFFPWPCWPPPHHHFFLGWISTIPSHFFALRHWIYHMKNWLYPRKERHPRGSSIGLAVQLGAIFVIPNSCRNIWSI